MWTFFPKIQKEVCVKKIGKYPSYAPIGYINDSRNKTIIADRKKAKIIKEIFELYAKGNSRLEGI